MRWTLLTLALITMLIGCDHGLGDVAKTARNVLALQCGDASANADVVVEVIESHPAPMDELRRLYSDVTPTEAVCAMAEAVPILAERARDGAEKAQRAHEMATAALAEATELLRGAKSLADREK